jgi:hypothetical protein
MFSIQQVRARRNTVSLDESWFYVSPDHEMILLEADEKFQKESDTLFSQQK